MKKFQMISFISKLSKRIEDKSATEEEIAKYFAFSDMLEENFV